MNKLTRFLYENSLSIALTLIFLILLLLLSWAGYNTYNQEQLDHAQQMISYGRYLQSGHFISAVTENWESEFLQMASYLILTAILVQKGSAESRPLHSQPLDTKTGTSQDSPVLAKMGGWLRTLYSYSLTIVFAILFIVSFLIHLDSSYRSYLDEASAHGEEAISLSSYFQSHQFWFESLQNWQSEFLAVALLVVLSIFLRQKGSPESKDVDDPHYQTGTE